VGGLPHLRPLTLRKGALRIGLVTPAPPGSTGGNRVTALRWARILRGLGHRVRVTQRYAGEALDLLVALHARKSAESVAAFARDHPRAPIVVTLTGTDVYHDLGRSAAARRSLALATRIVALQPLAGRELPASLRAKVRVVHQSARRPSRPARRRSDIFEVAVLAHLRAVKDPLRAARAARLLPAGSRIRILHLGAPLDPRLARQARREAAGNPRYRWLGERPRGQALRILARCRLLVLTSRLEGGANAVSEAVVCGVPVISSRIAGSVGLLGSDYPGYFPPGDTRALARLLERAERDGAFRARLAARGRRLRPRFAPARERAAWRRLIEEARRRPEGVHPS
jgi:putative glycosyltransferase (TIGR04348 family)